MLVNTPPMGWNSWNTFGTNISEDLIKETADAMVDTGLAAAGYNYVVIDDCWSLRERGADGRIVPDPEKFPSGMKALADYVHSKGLKFGMYSCDGPLTCAGYPGSYNNEFIDAQTFADWGVDFLKYDNCYKPEHDGYFLYNRMSMALKSTGRDILFSACNWGAENVHRWIRSTGAHIFRSTGDINDSFGSVKNLVLSQTDNWPFSGPQCFNDIDLLITGMYGKGNVAVSGCTDEEYLTHFALWCYFASPLMIGCDIRNMSDATLKTLTNKELIRINQDTEARTPALIGNPGDDTYCFLKHLDNGTYSFAFINFGESYRAVCCDFFKFGITLDTGYAFDFEDVIDGQKWENITREFNPGVPAHGCRIIRGTLHPKA